MKFEKRFSKVSTCKLCMLKLGFFRFLNLILMKIFKNIIKNILNYLFIYLFECLYLESCFSKTYFTTYMFYILLKQFFCLFKALIGWLIVKHSYHPITYMILHKVSTHFFLFFLTLLWHPNIVKGYLTFSHLCHDTYN